MRPLLLITFVTALVATETQAQLSAEMSYGASRNVESTHSEVDGWMNGTVEWTFPSGLGIGIGTDHQFEDTAPSTSGHQSWAIYLSSSYEYPVGRVAPFVRAGVGAGPAPCEGDTCSSGAYFRGSGGLRVRLVGELRVGGEIGVSRVSRPFGGAGLSFRF